MELESWILGQLDSGAKYIVLDDFLFDMPHAETNWFLAMDIYTQWATGTVELEWSGFTVEYVVDLSLTGEALDQAAFNLWLDFVVSKEIDQAKHFSPSAFSIEDLPSNYVGFISYVNGSRDPDNRWSDMATTLADFGSSNFPMGERYAFGQRDTNTISRGEHIFQELEAATYGVYHYRNFGIEPMRNGFVVSWQGQYSPASLSSEGWVPR